MKNGQQTSKQPILVALGFVLACVVVTMSVSGALAAGETPLPAQEATNTPAGGFQFPTATQTLVGGPTSTPTQSPTPPPVQARVIGDPTNLRDGPGLDFEIIAELSPGELLPITGRWLGTDWLQVKWDDGPDGKAWVYSALIIVEGDITTVPAVEPPPAPTENPTVAAAEATATILVQTPGAVETATATALEAQLAAPQGVITTTPVPGSQGAGSLPTFTPLPENGDQLVVVPPATASAAESGGLPPAVLIIGLGVMGGLTLLLGVVRRLF